MKITEEDRDEIVFFLEQLLSEWQDQEITHLTQWKKRCAALDRRIESLKRLEGTE